MILVKYPKIYPIGHRGLEKLFEGEVEISEKLDGSQFRILFNEGMWAVGSHKQTGREIIDNMFNIGVKETEKIHDESKWVKIGDEVTLFCEYLYKHNMTLTYDRLPKRYLYLFGAIVDGVHQNTEQLLRIADIIGIEPPSIIYKGKIKDKEQLKELYH